MIKITQAASTIYQPAIRGFSHDIQFVGRFILSILADHPIGPDIGITNISPTVPGIISSHISSLYR